MDNRHEAALRRIYQADQMLQAEGREPDVFHLMSPGGMQRDIDHARWDPAWAVPSEHTIDDLAELELLRVSAIDGNTRTFTLTMKGRETAKALAPGATTGPNSAELPTQATDDYGVRAAERPPEQMSETNRGRFNDLEAFRVAYERYLNAESDPDGAIRRAVIATIPAADRALEAADLDFAIQDPPMTGSTRLHRGLANTAFLHEQPGFSDLRYLANAPEIYEGILDLVELAKAQISTAAPAKVTGSSAEELTKQPQAIPPPAEPSRRSQFLWKRWSGLPNWLQTGANFVTVVGGLIALVLFVGSQVTDNDDAEIVSCKTEFKRPYGTGKYSTDYNVTLRALGLSCAQAKSAVDAFERDPEAFVHGAGAKYNNLSKPFLVPVTTNDGPSNLECRYSPQGLGGTEHTLKCDDGQQHTVTWTTRQL